MRKDNLRKSIIWNTIGSSTLAITSLFYTIILTRLSSLAQVGLYTISFALACNTVTLASFGGRTYQVTDTKGEISTFSYILSRYTTVFFTLFVLIIYLLFKNYDIYKSVTILIICIFKYLEELCDVYYGIMQKNYKLYKVGIFQFVKSLINIFIFLIFILLKKNLFVVFILLFIIDILYFIFIERKYAIKCEKWENKVNKKELIKYFSANLFICILTFTTTYIINSPKYKIDLFFTNEIQAVFGIIVMPATIMLLIGNFILNPILVSIADMYNNNKISEITKIIYKIFGIMVFIGVIGLFGCYFFGVPLLNFVYSINFNDYKLSLMIIMVGSIFYAITAAISSILVAMRKIKSQVVGNLAVILISFLICGYLVKTYCILGGAIAYTLLIFTRFLIYVIILFLNLKQRIKRLK